MYCKRCTYSLSECPEARCPECGLPFDPADPESYLASPRWKWVARLGGTRNLMFRCIAGLTAVWYLLLGFAMLTEGSFGKQMVAASLFFAVAAIAVAAVRGARQTSTFNWNVLFLAQGVATATFWARMSSVSTSYPILYFTVPPLFIVFLLHGRIRPGRTRPGRAAYWATLFFFVVVACAVVVDFVVPGLEDVHVVDLWGQYEPDYPASPLYAYRSVASAAVGMAYAIYMMFLESLRSSESAQRGRRAP